MPKSLSVGPTNYRHMSLRLLLGLLFSSVIGLVAYRRQSLDKSGVLGAIVCGTSIVACPAAHAHYACSADNCTQHTTFIERLTAVSNKSDNTAEEQTQQES